MWLIDVDTRKLVSFMDDRKVVGEYAILSHTWGDEEVSFADFQTSKAKSMKGYKKIDLTCRQAKGDGLQYAWVDTCCINKDSSAELSEAINSMWRWYQNSKACYVWLEDTTFDVLARLHRDAKHRFEPCLEKILRGCRWITRGWTLQELLAPRIVKFYDREWVRLDAIEGFEDWHLRFALQEATGIPRQIMENRMMLEGSSLALRLSWASRRSTSRVEDEAYCLLGLLGINMPLLYGEGERAFMRLQEEIYRQSTDMSILFWHPYTQKQVGMLFAPDVFCFRVVDGETWARQRMSWETNVDSSGDNFITSRGLRTSIPLIKDSTCEGCYYYIADATSGRYLRFHELVRQSSSGGMPSNSSRELVVIRGCSEDEKDRGNFRPTLETGLDESLFTNVIIHRDVQYTLVFDLDNDLSLTHCDGRFSVDGYLVHHYPRDERLRVHIKHPWATRTAPLRVNPRVPDAVWEGEKRQTAAFFTDFRDQGILAFKCFDHEYQRFGYRNDIPPGTFIICVRKVALGTNLEQVYSKVKEKRAKLKGEETMGPVALESAVEAFFGRPPQRALHKITKMMHPEERRQVSMTPWAIEMAFNEVSLGASRQDSKGESSTSVPSQTKDQAARRDIVNAASNDEVASIQLSLLGEDLDQPDSDIVDGATNIFVFSRPLPEQGDDLDETKPGVVDAATNGDVPSTSIQFSQQRDTVDEPDPASHYHSSAKRSRLSRLFGRT